MLMNVTSKQAMGDISALKITSPLLSHKIIDFIRRNSGRKDADPLSNVAMDCFKTTNMFRVKSTPTKILMKIIKDVLVQRSRQPSGKKEGRFAPLVQDIVDNETIDKAGEVLEEVLTFTSNAAYIYQQLARLYIYSHSWQKASEYAEKATGLVPDSSYLWDTFGRVYLGRITETYNHFMSLADKHINLSETKEFIEVCFNGMDKFRQVQAKSLHEKQSTSNTAGYFGELEMVKFLLDCLNYVDGLSSSDTDKVKSFLLDPAYVPQHLRVLEDVNGIN